MKTMLFSMMLFAGLFVQSSQASDALPASLVDADWLSNHRADVVVLDVRKDVDSFNTEGHIEEAILVDVKKIRIERKIDGKLLTRMRPDAASFQQFMREHGINNNSRVVITHRGQSSGDVAGAARLYWHLKYFQFDNVALLDGGNAAWVAALEDLTSEPTQIVQGSYVVGDENTEILATLQQVRQSLDDDSITLIDTRELRYHIGIDKKDYVYAFGHIPGSRNLPYKFLNPAKGDAVYFSVETLVGIFEALRIDLNNSLILYCNSAYECSSVWFVLHELLGKQAVRVYDGSLHQWTQYAANPMTVKLTQ